MKCVQTSSRRGIPEAAANDAALTWKGSLPARACAFSLNSHSVPVGSFHSYGSEQVTSEMRSLPTMLHDCKTQHMPRREGLRVKRAGADVHAATMRGLSWRLFVAAKVGSRHRVDRKVSSPEHVVQYGRHDINVLLKVVFLVETGAYDDDHGRTNNASRP